jgi:hypothetical protein
LKIEDHFPSNPGRNAADLGAPGPAMAAFLVKGFPLFRVNQTVHLSITDLMDLRANRVADSIPEKVADPAGYFHGPCVLGPVFQLFPPHQAGDRQDRPDEGTAGFPHPDDSAGQSASRLEHLVASHPQLFLQSRKNGLGSADIGHIILQRQLKDLIQKFLPIGHALLLPSGSKNGWEAMADGKQRLLRPSTANRSFGFII